MLYEADRILKKEKGIWGKIQRRKSRVNFWEGLTLKARPETKRNKVYIKYIKKEELKENGNLFALNQRSHFNPKCS